MTDLQIWQNFKKGDRKAFKAMYDQNINSITKYCLQFSKENDLISDCIHDLFVRLWNNRETIGDTDNIVKYLCVSLRRDIIRKISKEKLTSTFDINVEYNFECQLSPEESLIQNEQYTNHIAQVKIAMESLSSRQKEAIYLKYFKDMSYDEICEIMDINYQSVRNLISKGMLALRGNITIFIAIFMLLYSFLT